MLLVFIYSHISLQKERDLELAARIGQTLLSQNKSLKSKNDELKSELSSCNEIVSLITIIFHSLIALVSRRFSFYIPFNFSIFTLCFPFPIIFVPHHTSLCNVIELLVTS